MFVDGVTDKVGNIAIAIAEQRTNVKALTDKVILSRHSLSSMFSTLAPVDHKIAWCIYISGMSYREIAAELTTPTKRYHMETIRRRHKAILTILSKNHEAR